jgi:hypothetical protein
MLRFKQKTLIFISGVFPFTVGFFLIKMGFNLLVTASSEMEVYTKVSYPLLSLFVSIFSSHQTALFMLILLACFIGYMKGKYVISRTTKRNIIRLQSLPQPIRITQLYTVPYYILVAGMMGLGLLMNAAGVPKDVRGLIDSAVGFALIEGSLLAFRTTLQRLKTSP